MAYLKNPDKIYRESFAAIRRECDLSTIPPEMEKIILRMVHRACDQFHNGGTARVHCEIL